MNKIEHVSLARTHHDKWDFIGLWVNRTHSCQNFDNFSFKSGLRLARMKYIFNSFMEMK
jgi:hypothetical protein